MSLLASRTTVVPGGGGESKTAGARLDGDIEAGRAAAGRARDPGQHSSAVQQLVAPRWARRCCFVFARQRQEGAAGSTSRARAPAILLLTRVRQQHGDGRSLQRYQHRGDRGHVRLGLRGVRTDAWALQRLHAVLDSIRAVLDNAAFAGGCPVGRTDAE